jgi:hypothetical protein
MDKRIVPGVNDTDWGFSIVCPVDDCTCQYVHIGHVYNVHGKDNYQAWQGRGDAAVIPMYCEEGHQWLLRLGEHKGYTYIGNDPHPDGVNKWKPK